METNKSVTGNARMLHPSFFQYLSVFIVPLALFLLIPIGVKIVYVLMTFWIFELLLLFCVWLLLATTSYAIQADRIEIRCGIFVKRSTTISFDKIINVTCKQTIFQRLFGIGDIFIELPGMEPAGIIFSGIEKHEKTAGLIFSLKNRGSV
jgi:uncharacterized membrane protein YdbT with pleckstrin-like domain